MTFKVELRPFKKLPRARAARAEVEAWLAGTVNLARNIFVKGMQRGPHTGKVYRYRRGGSSGVITHRASAPGAWPATDTGRLVNGTAMEVAGLKGRLGTNVAYAKYLAHGTTHTKPRKMYHEAIEEATAARIDDLPKTVRFR